MRVLSLYLLSLAAFLSAYIFLKFAMTLFIAN